MPDVKTIVKLIIVTSALEFLAGCADSGPPKSFQPVASGLTEGHKIYFSMNDPIGDDKGPGYYQYPLEFDNREGFFDITKFSVEDGGANVIFRIAVRRPIQKFRPDGSSEEKGWFMQLMDIYIDKDHRPHSGETECLPGRFCQFPDDQGWEQMILVSPWPLLDTRRLIESRTNDMHLVHLKPKIVIADIVFVEAYEFVVVVPKGLIGEPQPNWGYQCLMMQFEPTNLANYEFQNNKVLKFPTDKQFGGGSDFLGNPCVLDMLAPTDEDQRRWLGSYVASSNPEEIVPATIPMMYAPALGKPPILYASRKTHAATALGSIAVRRPAASAPGARKALAPVAHASWPSARPVEEQDPSDLGEDPPAPPPRRAAVRRVRPISLDASNESDSSPPQPKRYKPVQISGSGYSRETFSGETDGLFDNVPRSR